MVLDINLKNSINQFKHDESLFLVHCKVSNLDNKRVVRQRGCVPIRYGDAQIWLHRQLY